uniref:Nucleic acid-binding protein n=1 Tax=uncultured Thiotrichaceae bacterium TaxID=298394 RepID=A0A6S6S519_9GAMM|nr:MAG: Nucleic acid-binding protein [uncultured Thiotrichaceae bacterium]
MPEQENKTIVTNTSPLIGLIAAWGGLEPLKDLYQSVIVPKEVNDELLHGGSSQFGVEEFEAASFLDVQARPTNISKYLNNSLDRGEAAVIQLALDQEIETVCIDESIGRRVARMNGLALTGSVGILARYKQELQPDFSLVQAVERMRGRGIRLGKNISQFAALQDAQVSHLK